MRGRGKIVLSTESLEQGVGCDVWAMLTSTPRASRFSSGSLDGHDLNMDYPRASAFPVPDAPVARSIPRRRLTLRRITRRVRDLWFAAPLARDVLVLLSCWVALSVLENVRYPALEPSFWYFRPSVDATVLLVALAVCGVWRWRVPSVALGVVAFLFAFVRLFRVADGVTERMQHRGTNIFIDAQLFPGLVQLAYTTVPTEKLVLMTGAGLVVLALVAWLAYRILMTSARILTDERRVLVFGTCVLGFTALGTSTGSAETRQWQSGAFAASVVPRLGDDFTSYWDARSFPEQVQRQVAAQAHLHAGSQILSELRGANVLLIFVESYGETVLSYDQYRQPVLRAYERWDSSLRPLGFNIASHVLESPTVGGYSWLAHITLATGIKVTDQVRYKRLYQMRPKTIVHYFKEAGYQTLLVQPATMRDPGDIIYPFSHHRYSWEFGYRGRNFSWAPMPDQFVMDWIRRNEIDETDAPLFVEYNLVSGHMPWNNQAPIVEDWEQIGDGSMYRDMAGIRFNTDWSNLTHAHEAYLTAMLYDLEVLRQYITKFVRDDTLLIILGDHQPVGEVTGNTESRGAPIHVVSKNPRFTEKFVARGYNRGMRPENRRPYPGMELFMSQFIEDFSR